MRAETALLSDLPDAWHEGWDALSHNASEPNPFGERWFVEASARNLDRNLPVRAIAVFDDATMIGLMPLAVAPRYGRLPVAHVENWIHYHNFLGTPLVIAGRERDFWTCVLETLDQADWAPAFLHLIHLPTDSAVLTAIPRRADIVHRSRRALLARGLSSGAYYETHVRKKKRKEIGRLNSRLRDLGPVAFERLTTGSPTPWAEEFLAIEAAGWKGRGGTALMQTPETRGFFLDAVKGAAAAGRLEMIRMTLADKPIAMLVNFLTPPGSFSFKIAFDEDYARFSPGVLIEIENLKIIDRGNIDWMDSCAVDDHSMINSLWAERRDMVRVTIPLTGARRRLAFAGCRALENGSAMVRQWR